MVMLKSDLPWRHIGKEVTVNLPVINIAGYIANIVSQDGLYVRRRRDLSIAWEGI